MTQALARLNRLDARADLTTKCRVTRKLIELFVFDFLDMEKKPDFPQFDFNAPDQALEWQVWSKRFRLSLTLLPKKKLSDERKLAALRLWSGVDFDALIDQLMLKETAEKAELVKIPLAPPQEEEEHEELTEFERTMKVLDKHFDKKKNAMYPMTAFRMMKQGDNESIGAFGARLRKHASMCGASQQDLILQVFTGARLISIKKKAAKAKDFENLLSIAELEESIDKQLQPVEKSEVSDDAKKETVSFIQNNRGGGRGRQFARAARSDSNRHPYGRGSAFTATKCGNCGGAHRVGDEKCFAKGKICYSCGGMNHLAAFCRKSLDKASNRGGGGGSDRSNPLNRREKDAKVEEIDQIQDESKYDCYLPKPDQV